MREVEIYKEQPRVAQEDSKECCGYGVLCRPGSSVNLIPQHGPEIQNGVRELSNTRKGQS